MGPLIYVLTGAAFGLLIGYGVGWARAMREAGAMSAMLARDLTDEEAAELLTELNRIIQNDRYPLSQRIRAAARYPGEAAGSSTAPAASETTDTGRARPEPPAAWLGSASLVSCAGCPPRQRAACTETGQAQR
jgi:hypothetical protein